MRLLACALACTLAACATAPPTAPALVESRTTTSSAPPAKPAPSSADELVAYLARLRAMNEANVAMEVAQNKPDASDMGRVKTALALSLTTPSDEAEIIALVEPLEKRDGVDRNVRAMAGFLHAMALERRRSKESAAARLRDERRLAEVQKQRADQLQQKLDALTELEKSLSDRPTPSDAQAR